VDGFAQHISRSSWMLRRLLPTPSHLRFRSQTSTPQAFSSWFVGTASRFGPLAVDLSISSSLSKSYITERADGLFSAPLSLFLSSIVDAQVSILPTFSHSYHLPFSINISIVTTKRGLPGRKHFSPNFPLSYPHQWPHTVTRQSPANIYKGWPGNQSERQALSTAPIYTSFSQNEKRFQSCFQS
jgi:hypothetical protein